MPQRGEGPGPDRTGVVAAGSASDINDSPVRESLDRGGSGRRPMAGLDRSPSVSTGSSGRWFGLPPLVAGTTIATTSPDPAGKVSTGLAGCSSPIPSKQPVGQTPRPGSRRSATISSGGERQRSARRQEVQDRPDRHADHPGDRPGRMIPRRTPAHRPRWTMKSPAIAPTAGANTAPMT